ncbi:MAG: MBOAT family protein [Acetobacteraceae bacterium]|nr:MBOAT family protein [Acetobacteraceae bacterium]
MVFSSFPFIFSLLPLALLGFFVAARMGAKPAGLWLVLASLAFYAYWRVDFLPLLLISITFNYLIGDLLVRTRQRPGLQQAIFLLGIGADLAALFYYKYAAALAAWLGLRTLAGMPLHDIILPLGISFFTFTQIGYLVDVKQEVAKTRDPLSYVLFVTFFPHLIAGPILHNREMMPQFADPTTYRFSISNIAVGLTIFAIGLAKKVLLADPLSADVAMNFGHTGELGLISAWYAVIGYSLQLYFDFSGYSDMAIGLARMFNIRFPLNFNSPYKATTVIDYWQRFHMTLTRFITMYIFSPMALAVTRWRDRHGYDNGRKASSTPFGFLSLIAGPTLVTMGLAGIWHGAGTQYLIFGLLHGLYISVNHATRTFFPAPKKPPPRPALVQTVDHAAKVLAVYVAALVAFAFFRAPSTGAALQVLAGMAGLHGLGSGLGLGTLAHLGVLFAIVWFAPNTQQIMNRYEPSLGRPVPNPYPTLSWNPRASWAVAAGTVAALGVLALGGTTEFLYFQF